MRYSTDNRMSVTSSVVVVYVYFMSLVAIQCKKTNAVYATCMEMLIETALLNETLIISGYSLDIVSWTLYSEQLRYQHYTSETIGIDLYWRGIVRNSVAAGARKAFIIVHNVLEHKHSANNKVHRVVKPCTFKCHLLTLKHIQYADAMM